MISEKVCFKEIFEPEFSCLRVDELQALLRLCGRHSAYYTFFLLKATTGIRTAELLYLTLMNFSPDCKTITYRIAKPKVDKDADEIMIHRKHRRVVLDDWVAGEVKQYFDNTFAATSVYGHKTYVSPWSGFDPNAEEHRTQMIFRWKDSKVVNAYFWKLKRRMQEAGFDVNRLETSYVRSYRSSTENTYVFRMHMFRHFAVSIMYYKLNKDIKAVQRWVHHSKTETTAHYCHPASALGVTEEFVVKADWASICGFKKQQMSISKYEAPEQTCLNMF